MSLIQLRNISKLYQTGSELRSVLHNINLEIHAGELVAIIGASGSGKSTLMNIIGLLDQPTRGEYLLNERNFQDLSSDELAAIRNRQIGFIFQAFYLLPRLTVLENVSLPLLYQNCPPEESQQHALQTLQHVGMAEYANRYPNQLSGGQQQRVAIARALISQPQIILADEPTGALDSKTSHDVMQFLQKLHREEKRTILIVTHNPEVAAACQRVIKISDGDILEDYRLPL